MSDAVCVWCGRKLSEFSRRVHPVGATDAWAMAAKEHAADCWWITSRAGHLSKPPAPTKPEPDPRRAASVALLRAMDREPRSYLIEVLRAVHAGADRDGADSLLALLREAFGASTDYQPAITRRALPIPPDGAFCTHTKMTECHPGCGHFSCPCGVFWDEGSEGR